MIYNQKRMAHQTLQILKQIKVVFTLLRTYRNSFLEETARLSKKPPICFDSLTKKGERVSLKLFACRERESHVSSYIDTFIHLAFFNILLSNMLIKPIINRSSNLYPSDFSGLFHLSCCLLLSCHDAATISFSLLFLTSLNFLSLSELLQASLCSSLLFEKVQLTFQRQLQCSSQTEQLTLIRLFLFSQEAPQFIF